MNKLVKNQDLRSPSSVIFICLKMTSLSRLSQCLLHFWRGCGESGYNRSFQKWVLVGVLDQCYWHRCRKFWGQQDVLEGEPNLSLANSQFYQSLSRNIMYQLITRNREKGENSIILPLEEKNKSNKFCKK